MGVAAQGEQKRKADGDSPGQTRAMAGDWLPAAAPSEQGPEAEARHHKQRRANGDRKRVIAALGQKQAQE